MAQNIEVVSLTKQYLESANPKNKELVQDYLENSTELSDKTLKQYKSALEIWISYINKFLNNKNLYEVRPIEFQKYLNWLYKNGLYEAGIKMKRSAISSLNEYMILYYGDLEEYKTFRNFVTKAVKTPATGKRRVKIPLTTEEFKKLCEYLEEHEEWQKLAYFKFTYSTACRREESRQLLKEVVDYPPILKKVKLRDENGQEYVADVKKYKTNLIKTKGKKSKEKVKLSFDEETLMALKKWLEVRGEDDCEYMFISGKTNPHQIGMRTFEDWCTQLSDVIGRKIYPHLLRSSRATNLFLEGKSVEAISRLLGHKDISTTKIYIVKDDDDEDDEIFAE